MDSNFIGKLSGYDIHGFHTTQDLDVPSIMREAQSRWLRPNEIHAILSNYTYFTINVKPVNLPPGGTIVLFDRKKLRNFRKDGHNWRKKKDGKTVKEAHEHLKVGTEERIHVYYAHGEDNPKFVRRCYWLLDKALEHIVLVHYRETQEMQGSPVTPVSSGLSSDLTDISPSQLVLSGTGCGAYQPYHSITQGNIEVGDSVTSHEMRLHEINTLDWDDLLASNDLNQANLPESTASFQQYDRPAAYNMVNNGSNYLINHLQDDPLASRNPAGAVPMRTNYLGNSPVPSLGGQMDLKQEIISYDVGRVGGVNQFDKFSTDKLQSQDSFGRWINEIVVDSPGSVDDPSVDTSVTISHGSFVSPGPANQEASVPKQIFCITEISPSWVSSIEDTKILVVGFFHQEYQHLMKSSIFVVCGDVCVPTEMVQVGVYRCSVSPQSPGFVNLYLSIDGCTPISRVLSFEYRSPSFPKLEGGEDRMDMFQIQTRLANLLFSTSKTLDILSSKVPQKALKEGNEFALNYSNTADTWAYFTKLIVSGKISLERAKDSLIELAIKSRLKEWLLERIVDGCQKPERDRYGQGVLHLCAILDYTWAVYPYSSSGLSLDFRDKFGWTALHWAAYYGREKMVGALLSAGAKANLVTDPTADNPGGCLPADLASKQGFEGLAAYLSEKALVQQFKDMQVAGNASGTLETPSYETINDNISEEESYLKDTLTAYRTAADAAARIQSAFREQSLKQRTEAVGFSNPEEEARYIISAMKIQHAFRNYESKKKMIAAVRIQHRFRTWKMRQEFLNMRRQAIKIQAIFRGFQVRRQYKKICWSVGILEKAVLRWRLKRKGLRGLEVENKDTSSDDSFHEEDFYRANRKLAEERVEKAVVRVQAMFRSKQAQLQYHRMKLAHRQAEIEYGESAGLYRNMGQG